jgi:sirohydrochlorin ferrochelatase
VPVHALEVVLLAAGARDREAELEEDRQAREGEETTDYPEEERDADGAGYCEDA